MVDELPTATSGEHSAAGELELDRTTVVGPAAVAVLVTGSEVEAEFIRGLLVDAEIPAQVWSSGFGAYLGHASSVGTFAHRVMVHPDDLAEAREIIDAAPEVPQPGR